MSESVDKAFVTFANGRYGVGGSHPPMIITHYKDPYGISRKFRDIPLYKADGEPDMIENIEGNTVQRKYGFSLKFDTHPRLRLHKEVHKDVIQAIRDLRYTVSTQKSEGLPKVIRGKIIEIEPEAMEQENYKNAIKMATAMQHVKNLAGMEGQDQFDWISVQLGLSVKSSFKARIASMTELALNNTSDFVSVLEGDDKTEVKRELINPSIVKIAVQRNVIKNRGGIYYFNDYDLGVDVNKIHSEHQDMVGQIKAAVDSVSGNRKPTKKKNPSPPAENKGPEPTSDEGTDEIKISPAAAEILEEAGIDPSDVEGTGKDNGITKADAVRAVEALQEAE